jgi:Uma2 family endonuclease
MSTRGWNGAGILAPLLIAIEVASRGNTPDELEFKKELYLAHGDREVWIVTTRPGRSNGTVLAD